MIAKTLIALALVAATVSINAFGLAFLVGKLLKTKYHTLQGSWHITWAIIRVAWMLILIHFLSISVWALFFYWQGCLPDVVSAFYFSGVTYTTVGYGDVVLPDDWRLFGPIEGLTGILMCGLTTGYFFAVVSKLIAKRNETTSID